MDYLTSTPIELAVFDLDGTLVDSDEAISCCFNLALTEMGLPAQPVQHIARLIGLPLLDMFAQFVAPGEEAEAVRRYRSHYTSVCLEKTVLLAGAVELLQMLRKRGIRMAIATNKPLVFTQKILESTGIDAYFDWVAGPEQAPLPKPDPGMLIHVMDQLSAHPARTMYVGDSLIDCHTAKAARVSMFAVATGAHTVAELSTAEPFWLGLSLDELKKFLLREEEGLS